MPEQEITPTVRKALRAHSDTLWQYPNVIGTGVGFRRRHGEYTSEIVITVFVSRKFPESYLRYPEIIPRHFPGPNGEPIQTDIIDAGFFRPTGPDTHKYRPVEGGCSIGPIGVGVGDLAGTLGGWAWDNTDNSVVLVTCNHVLTTDDTTMLPSDRDIVQPAVLDGGIESQDTIGQSKRIYPIPVTTNPPYPTVPVDCGVASITVPWSDEILQMGEGIFTTQPPTLGMPVQKRGRTTLLTTGTIVMTDVTVQLGYSSFPTQSANVGPDTFLVASSEGLPFAADGDSGALVASTETDLTGAFPIIGCTFTRICLKRCEDHAPLIAYSRPWTSPRFAPEQLTT
jgi:hypothetical protein